MATRRPKVPSAQFTSGPTNAPASHPSPESSATTRPTSAHQDGGQPASGASHQGAPAASAQPAGRNRREGVIRNDDSAPVPARTFNGRLLVVGLAMVAITVMLAPNVHTYVTQRAEISALRVDIAAQQSKQDVYKGELARWDDPAYVKQQARDRVSMLMPGETGYWVYGANGVETPAGTPGSAKPGSSAKDAVKVEDVPWVDGLWNAVQKSAAVTPTTAPKAPATTAPAPTPSKP